MATKAEVRQQVGEDLGIVPIGQNLESQDQLRIDTAYTQVYGRLKELGLAAWPVLGPVPDQLVPYFCLMVEQKLLTSYSVPDNRYVRINTDAGPDGTEALKQIASLIIQEYDSTRGPADY
jgi:hypothetical protein